MSSKAPTNAQAPTNAKSNRLPAPTLFVGPPSHNASQLSVTRPDPNQTTRDPLARQKSALTRTPETHTDGAKNGDRKHHHKMSDDAPRLKKPSNRSIDARWREMQSTLNEVELTAQSSTHVFGAEHVKALDELRNAQVALAKAWGRGNEEAADVEGAEGLGGNSIGGDGVGRFAGSEELAKDRAKMSGGNRARAGTETSASTVLTDESAGTDRTGAKSVGRSTLEDETAQDIRLASERRAANEAYFNKVDGGVKEVVERLEKVAEAMRGVEQESRSLWSESGSGSEAGGGEKEKAEAGHDDEKGAHQSEKMG